MFWILWDIKRSGKSRLRLWLKCPTIFHTGQSPTSNNPWCKIKELLSTARLTLLTIPPIAVKISCLYRWMQKSFSSSWAKLFKIPQPALLLSREESVSVCSNKILTICSRSNSFRHLVSSMMLAIATAAADLVFSSGLWRSLSDV